MMVLKFRHAGSCLASQDGSILKSVVYKKTNKQDLSNFYPVPKLFSFLTANDLSSGKVKEKNLNCFIM